MTKINMKTLTIKQEDRNPNSTESIAYRLNYIIRKKKIYCQRGRIPYRRQNAGSETYKSRHYQPIH